MTDKPAITLTANVPLTDEGKAWLKRAETKLNEYVDSDEYKAKLNEELRKFFLYGSTKIDDDL